MSKPKAVKVRAHAIVKGDRLDFAGKRYHVTDNEVGYIGSDRRHIRICPVGGDSHYESIAFFLPALKKLKVYPKQ